MYKSVIKLFAFFAKELHHIRRQPGLVISLILGPVLILLIFGIGYSPNPPDYKVIVAWPQSIQEDAEGVGLLKTNIEKYFNVLDYYQSEEQAIEQFENRRTDADALLLIPEDAASGIKSGDQVRVRILLNEIDPQQERFMEHAFDQFFDDVNGVMLEDSIEQIQTESGETQGEVQQVTRDLQQLNSALDNNEIDETRESIDSLRNSLELLSSSGLLEVYSETNRGSQSNEIEELSRDLEELDKILASGEIQENEQRINDMRNRLNSLEDRLEQVERVPPSSIVAPIKQNFENLFGEPYNLQVFFSPRVLALVLQHIAITLGALALVRETSRGTLEYFGVAPTSGSQTLIGKFLAYLVILAIIAALLIVSMIYVLGVPQIGNYSTFAGFVGLYLFANLSIGFLISVISKTESQAIQASMLFLLVTIFFSGFILPLKNFRNSVRQLGMLLPITHANQAFTDILLIGQNPDLMVWAAVSLVGIGTFVGTAVLWVRQYRNLE